MEHTKAGKSAARSAPEGKKAAPLARASSEPRAAAEGAGGWFVRLQGSQCEMIESKERPENTPNEGEALIRLIGPFQDRETAEKVHGRMASRTLGAGPRERGRSEA